MISFYEVLEIDQNASFKDIQRAYYEKALKFHPDKNQENKTEALKSFQLICRAYKVLGDSKHRELYDKYLLNSSPKQAMGQSSNIPCPNLSKSFCATQCTATYYNYMSFQERKSKATIRSAATTSFLLGRTSQGTDCDRKISDAPFGSFNFFLGRRSDAPEIEKQEKCGKEVNFGKAEMEDDEADEFDDDEESEEEEEDEEVSANCFPSFINSIYQKNSMNSERIRKTIEELLWKKKNYDEETEKKKYLEKIRQRQNLPTNMPLFKSKKIRKYKQRAERQKHFIYQNLRKSLPVFKILRQNTD